MLSILFALWMTPTFAQQKVEVKTFSPQGFVKSVEQVRIEFNQPMVKFGEIKLDSPVQSACFDPKKGQGRWVDTKNWVFDYTTPLPGGHACEVAFGAKKFSFNTGGPHVTNMFPRLYEAVAPDQHFVLVLDSEVQRDSLKGGIYFLIEGLGDRIPAQVLSSSQSRAVVDAAKKMFKYEEEQIKDPLVVVKAARDFPAGAKATLVWSKDIQSPAGYKSQEEQTFEFSIEEPFKADFSCDREGPGKPCVPLLPLYVNLNSTISLSQAKQIYLQTSDKKVIRPTLFDNPEADENVTNLEFKGPFPENTQYTLFIPNKLKDTRGRLLTNQSQYPLKVSTGDLPALLKFAAPFGVIEAGKEAAMAVSLRRVESTLDAEFMGWQGRFSAVEFPKILQALSEVQRRSYGETAMTFPEGRKKEKILIKKPLKASDLELVGIPLKSTGFFVVEMTSPLLGQSLLNKNEPYYVRSAALVTNMAVHLKYTDEETLVWVTDLKSGKSVAGADVQIYDTLGNEIIRGSTNAQGLIYFRFPKPMEQWPKNTSGSFYGGFFAVAQKQDDFSFTHSSWDRGIETWRYQLNTGWDRQDFFGHAIVDRNLLRPEETLSAKLILRKQQSGKLALPALNEWPDTLQVSHDSGLQTFKFPLAWNKKTGASTLSWKIPAGTKLGRWTLTMTSKNPERSIEVGDIAIENFRIPALEVGMSAAKPLFILDKSIPLQVHGKYLSGGGAAGLDLKLRWSVEPLFFDVEDEDLRDYRFLNGSIKEGTFRSGEEEARFTPQSGVQQFKLSAHGTHSARVDNVKYGTAPQRLRVDLEYKDPNGEIQNSLRSFSLWSSSAVVGIKAKSWSAKVDKVEFDIVALDLQQKPLANQEVRVDLFTSKYISHRKRLVGGFYSYEGFQTYKKINEHCRGKTNAKGQFLCTGKSPVSGNVIAVVSTKDSDGRIVYANAPQWILKEGETQWFGSSDSDRVDLIPFKKSYEPGQVAEFQLRSPFPSAQVLVTVERESVLHREVIEVNGDNPTIRIPIKKEYAPNVVISAFLVRGRLSDPKPTALVDLGRPAFKMGMAHIKVGWKEHTLKVQVKTDKKSYKARDTANTVIEVLNPQGRPAANADVSVVAVDEGLLQLRDNQTWDVLSSMMRLRAHHVQSATAQSWVVGRRHFGLKAVPIGGDGGGGLRRELFDTLLYWKASVKLDAKGRASIPIKLNDSTTSFRIVAIAADGIDKFGMGWTSIQSSQEIIITPGLAAVAREGDDYKAGFNVRNATEVPKKINLSLQVNQKAWPVQSVTIPAGEAKDISWAVKVPATTSLRFVVSARDENNKFLDEVQKDQQVLPVRVPRIYQSEWGQWPDFKGLSLRQPEGADPLQSRVLVDLQAGLSGQFTGVQEFWKNYSYTCLEQQISKAVSLNDKKLWTSIESKLATYFDNRGLLKYFPGQGGGSVALTAYVLSVAHEAGFKFSDENENRLLESMTSYAEGRLRETGMDRADTVLKKVSAFEALSRYRRLNTQLLTSVEYRGTEWPLYSLVEWYQIHLLEKDIPQREQKLKDIENTLRSKFYFSAKRLLLKDESQSSMSWLMRDGNSGLLRLILATLDQPQWKSDSPRLFQGIVMRQKAGAWYLTTDNAWGSVMLRKFQGVFDSAKVEGTFNATLGTDEKSHAWNKSSEGHFDFAFKQADQNLVLKQEGAGKPWVTVSMKAAAPVKMATFAGFSAEKTITPLEQKKKGTWSVGDTAMVRIKVKAPASQSWVVIDDPIPSGASVLRSSSATAVERKSELVRFYHEWLSAGESEVEYTMRFNQAGQYNLPVTRIEAMYSPDVFAELPESSLKVEE